LNFEFFHLFEAQIAPEILDMLDNPTKPTSFGHSLTITRRKIPFEPYETFRERLMAEMLASEPVDCCEVSHINHDVDLVIKKSVKRQRETVGGERLLTRLKLVASS
jgi:hypothetical protein